MYHFYYKVPASSIFTEIDGNDYAYVGIDLIKLQFVECKARMLRATGCAIEGGYALVPIGQMGDKIVRLSGLPENVVYQYRA